MTVTGEIPTIEIGSRIPTITITMTTITITKEETNTG